MEIYHINAVTIIGLDYLFKHVEILGVQVKVWWRCGVVVLFGVVSVANICNVYCRSRGSGGQLYNKPALCREPQK